MGTSTIAILVVVGVFTACVIAFVVWLISKLLIKRNKQHQYEETKAKVQKKLRKHDNIYTSVDTFEIPVSFKTVTAQTGTKTNGQKMSVTVTPASDHGSVSIKSNATSKSKAKSRFKKLDRQASINSINSSRDRQSISHDLDKRKRISIAMMQHLKKQGKLVTSATIRPISQSDDVIDHHDNNLQEQGYLSDGSDASTASGFSIISGSSVKSGASSKSFQADELFDSTSIGTSKKKIASKRGGTQDKIRYKKAGKLIFTTSYSEEEKTLIVEIIRGFDFARKINSNELNPYIRVYLDPGKKQTHNTKYQKGTRNPYINERVNFYDIDQYSLNCYKMKLKAYNHGHVKKNQLIGEVDIALSSLDINVKETFSVDLFVKRKEVKLGFIMISICHQATFSKLEVLIQSAKDLPKKAMNPYVRASLYREDSIDSKETTTKKNTKNPEFNEVLEFAVATDASTPLDTFSLVVSLISRSVIGKDDIIGHVIFSSFSPQESGFYQWQAVVNEPHKRFIEWHNLYDPGEL